MTHSVQVRMASLSDEAALFPLIQAFPTPTPVEAQAYDGMFRQKLADPSAFVAVAHEGPTLVGYISGHRHAAFYAGGDTAWVDEVLVLESMRGNGIGRMLMDAFERWANRAGCKLVALATRGAADFYGQLGYVSNAGYFKKYLTAD